MSKEDEERDKLQELLRKGEVFEFAFSGEGITPQELLKIQAEHLRSVTETGEALIIVVKQ